MLKSKTNQRGSSPVRQWDTLLEPADAARDLLESGGLRIPASSASLLQLQLLLTEPVLDLAGVATVIKGDLGLMFGLLQILSRQSGDCPDRMMPVSQLAVLAGSERLWALARETRSLPNRMESRVEGDRCSRFWKRARLTALLAEEIARQYTNIPTEEAYFAGMFCRLGDLPPLLHWREASGNVAGGPELIYEYGRKWNFPPVLLDVIRGDRSRCGSESKILLDVTGAALVWASRLEFLAARDGQRQARPAPHMQ